MPVVKRIVCLANSRKLSGRCVAGKEIAAAGAGAWIRPVSDRPMEEVSLEERRYADGNDPVLRDIIDVPLREPRPKTYQSENWLLDPEYYWVRVGRASWKDLGALADRPKTLWLNGSSTRQGKNDRVAVADAQGLPGSLLLIPLEQARIRVFAPGKDFGNRKRRVQARFRYNGTEYDLWVTDPIVEREYLAGEDGEFSIGGESFATISLGEPHDDGFCYKLVAGLMMKGSKR
jgi:hypothetical protein